MTCAYDEVRYLPPPRRLRVVSVCLFVCLLATLRKTSERIYIKFSGKVGNGPMNNWLNCDGDPDHRLDIQRLFSGFVTVGRYGKWYQSTALRDAAVYGMHQQASPW